MRQTYKKLEVIIIYDDEEQTDLNFINSLIKNKRNIKLIINKKILEQENQEISVLKNQMVNTWHFLIVMITGKKTKLKHNFCI